jgi:peptide/nickel transport system permease protein
MLSYSLRRLAQIIPLLVGVITFTFVLIQLAPGDPVNVLLGEFPASPQFVADLKAELGLDKSVFRQYTAYVGSILEGDFGFSLRSRRPVLDLIVSRMPATLILMTTSMTIAAVVGVLLGVRSARKPYSLTDNVSSFISIAGFSMPVFFTGQILLIVLAVELDLFPVLGMRSIRNPSGGLSGLLDLGWHLTLPAMVLAFRYLAINTRITRASMLEVLERDFIITARSKGLSERRVVWRHGFRNALMPITTVMGFNFGYILTGSVLVESVFGWPGMGLLLFDSLSSRDHPVTLGIFIICAVTAMLANFLTDIGYAFLDPRIRFTKT